MNKKNREKLAKIAEADAMQRKAQPKVFQLTPQIAVSIQGEYPDQQLFIEAPNNSGSRHKIQLTKDTAFEQLMLALQAKAGEIALERLLAEEYQNKSRSSRVKPDWTLIAKHPMAEIRQGHTEVGLCAKGSITICPTRGSQLKSTKAEKSLEDMGL